MRYLEGQRNHLQRHTSRTSRIRKMDALRGSKLVSILRNLAMALAVHFEMSLAEGCNV